MNRPITDAVSAFRMLAELSSPGSIREGELDSRTANHDAAIDIEGAESLMSLHLQQRQAATSVHDTEAVDDTEDLENVQAQRSLNRGKKRKRNDSSRSGAKNALLRLERGAVHVEGVIRQTIRKASLMLSEDINDFALAEINIYMGTLSRLVRALVALQNTE
ncbi:hypothetical protein M501DRAFT_1015996 [Patellaria atrata CBS 101060]|uniref:Uncharacterized protein n=1 Tax=Patellaria atrata CBS 101060 TaxID=1346257 RepID=A0A9P4SC73_9PEZI|nr:hypothetical protein M501DRAFT_1015996 [Patellaria atrata CBS 101060]